MKKTTYIIIITILLCIVLHQHSVINQPLPLVIETDTVYTVDTVYYDRPVPYKVAVVDTIYIPTKGDSIVKLPITQKTYEDSTYHAVISGFQPNLDTLIVYPKTYTINTTKTVYKPKKGFKIAPTVGIGYGFFSNKIDVYAGVGISYIF